MWTSGASGDRYSSLVRPWSVPREVEEGEDNGEGDGEGEKRRWKERMNEGFGWMNKKSGNVGSERPDRRSRSRLQQHNNKAGTLSVKMTVLIGAWRWLGYNRVRMRVPE